MTQQQFEALPEHQREAIDAEFSRQDPSWFWYDWLRDTIEFRDCVLMPNGVFI